MKPEAELYSIRPDFDGSIQKWICDGLGENTDWIGDSYTFGICYGGRMVGGIIMNDYRKDLDVWLTIYSISPRWCSKSVLKYIFKTCFETLNCKRVNVFISKDNSKSLSLCERLGFVKEGLLRQYRENGQDCYILGMLKRECRWL
jgi:RimJ/RimL family protein N-acetyltransferase